MTNTAALLDRIQRSGLKRSYIAENMGLSLGALANKIANRSDFKAGEIDTLCSLLGIDSLEDKEAIFFASDVAE